MSEVKLTYQSILDACRWAKKSEASGKPREIAGEKVQYHQGTFGRNVDDNGNLCGTQCCVAGGALLRSGGTLRSLLSGAADTAVDEFQAADENHAELAELFNNPEASPDEMIWEVKKLIRRAKREIRNGVKNARKRKAQLAARIG